MIIQVWREHQLLLWHISASIERPSIRRKLLRPKKYWATTIKCQLQTSLLFKSCSRRIKLSKTGRGSSNRMRIKKLISPSTYNNPRTKNQRWCTRPQLKLRFPQEKGLMGNWTRLNGWLWKLLETDTATGNQVWPLLTTILLLTKTIKMIRSWRKWEIKIRNSCTKLLLTTTVSTGSLQ